jgi:hypothetical protein
MQPLNTSIIDIGQTQSQTISGLNSQLDFQGTFTVPFPNSAKLRVIVTPNFNQPWNSTNPGAAPVCTITELSASGFTAQATNESELGKAGLSLNWFAIEEATKTTTQTNVRMGVTIPQAYVPQNTPDPIVPQSWWQQTTPTFASALKGKSSVVLLTAADPFGSFKPQAAAVAGTVHKPSLTGFQMAGISRDSAFGSCAFNYVAAATGFVSDEPSLVVDTGELLSRRWVEGNGPGQSGQQWASMAIPFQRRFNEPPIVLVTASSVGLASAPNGLPPPVVGLVSDVTNDYFVINAFYIHSGSGFITSASFFWVAIGCGVGCGQGPSSKLG